MKVMVIVKATQDSEAGTLPEPQMLRDMGAYNEALIQAGIMQAGEGLYPSSQGARVLFSGKNRTVTDGPFAETKELIAGFWLWQVKSMEDAIEWVKRCPNPMLQDSVIEVRRVYAPEDFAPVDPTGEFRAQEADQQARAAAYILEPPRMEKAPERVFAGLSRNYTMETRADISRLWDKFAPSIGNVPSQVAKAAYGLASNEADGSFDYMAGVEVKDTSRLPSGFTSIRVPEQVYAVFTHRKHVSEIAKTLEAIFGKWLPNSGFKSGASPCIEKYGESFDPISGLGGIEIWVPVSKI